MSRRICFCCDQTWEMPAEAGEWFEHVRTPEYAHRVSTPAARARIAAYWEAKDLEKAGLLF